MIYRCLKVGLVSGGQIRQFWMVFEQIGISALGHIIFTSNKIHPLVHLSRSCDLQRISRPQWNFYLWFKIFIYYTLLQQIITQLGSGWINN